MSTQLILFPQTYEGQYSSISAPSTIQYIVNGINFTGFNSTTNYNTTAVHPSQDAIDNEHPYILGNWYRFTTTGGDYGAVSIVVYAVGAVQLSYNAVTPGQTGIYQKLSGLVVGAIYDVKISIVTPQAELLTFEMYDGTVLYHQAPLSANTSTITTTFTAQSSNDIFLIYYEGINASLAISKISILQSPTSPSLVYTELQDGQVICDLYQEEDIPLTLSIDDFKNVAEKVQSYSKDFNLPATKRNNQIFNNMFEVTRADDGLIFNPYVKTKCVLKEDGFILFEGYLRLIDVKDKEGEISYNVNLYSEVVALADVLKDKTFSELDFTELEHNYNKTSIKESWEPVGAGQGLPLINPLSINSFAYDAVTGVNNTQVLKYPFIDWGHQFLVGGSGTGSAATAGNPELTNLEQAFRPCIQLKYLINKIFAATNQFNWTSNFFDSTDFGKLFMDFNWGEGNVPVVFSTSGQSITSATTADNYAGTSYSNILMPEDGYGSFQPWDANVGFDDATGIFTATTDNTIYAIWYEVQLYFDDTTTVTIEWVSSTDGVINQTTHLSYTGATWFYQGWVVTTLNAGDTLFCRFKATHASRVKQNNNPVSGGGGFYTGYISADNISTGILLQTLRGELGQWDFLKGIMTMFNLVSMVDENNPDNILIEPYSDIFINNTNGGVGNLTLADRGIQHDWTDKIDASEMELKPLTDLNKNTIFKFVEDEDDYCFNVYKKSTSGHLYGSKEIDASGFTLLEGTKEIVAEPFAATVSKPLMPQFAQFVVPSLYAMSDEGTSEGFDNSPRIFYNNGEISTGASYYIPDQNTLSSENQPNFLQFSHLSDVPTIVSTPPAATDTRDFVFESQQIFSGLGTAPVDNLFSLYWQPYFNELYNADTRTMTLKVNLSPSDVAAFKFYDTVFVKNRVFRVNKIDYKPNDLATVEFILIP
jgi:hypothetical protein